MVFSTSSHSVSPAVSNSSFVQHTLGHHVFPTVPSWLWTTLAVVSVLLILEQSVYRHKKKGLPGDRWLIPVIGKFADSVNPTLQNYQRQWNLGALSCVSVFNMSVHTHTVLAWHSQCISPQIYRLGFLQRTHPENIQFPGSHRTLPCRFRKADSPTRQLASDVSRIIADLQLNLNRVFLTGKIHVDYRRVLNTLFTRKALGLVIHPDQLLMSITLLAVCTCL
jgi:sterol 22-desaturase